MIEMMFLSSSHTHDNPLKIKLAHKKRPNCGPINRLPTGKHSGKEFYFFMSKKVTPSLYFKYFWFKMCWS